MSIENSRISVWGMSLPKFSNKPHASILQERKGMKTKTLALIEGPQGVDSGPKVVSSLGP
jgi:hypothetical protein